MVLHSFAKKNDNDKQEVEKKAYEYETDSTLELTAELLQLKQLTETESILDNKIIIIIITTTITANSDMSCTMQTAMSCHQLTSIISGYNYTKHRIE